MSNGDISSVREPITNLAGCQCQRCVLEGLISHQICRFDNGQVRQFELAAVQLPGVRNHRRNCISLQAHRALPLDGCDVSLFAITVMLVPDRCELYLNAQDHDLKPVVDWPTANSRRIIDNADAHQLRTGHAARYASLLLPFVLHLNLALQALKVTCDLAIHDGGLRFVNVQC